MVVLLCIIACLPATFTCQFQALLQNTSKLLISGSDDHTLFLWSLSPSSQVNMNTKNHPSNPPRQPPIPNILHPILTRWLRWSVLIMPLWNVYCTLQGTGSKVVLHINMLVCMHTQERFEGLLASIWRSMFWLCNSWEVPRWSKVWSSCKYLFVSQIHILA